MTTTSTSTAAPKRWPIFPSLAGYQRRWARADLIAGLTVWAVLIPESLAYASIAGVSPVVGLYAAPAALVFYAMFGSSRHLVVGPMSATAALSAAAVADLTTDPDQVLAFTCVLAFVVGLLAIAASLLRLGFLANFISEPVLKGFVIGLALTILIGQVPKLFGFEREDGNFFEQLWGVVTNLGETHGLTLAIGLVSLAIVLGLREFFPIVPGSLVAVIVGVLSVSIFDLSSRGVAIVGTIESGLPPLGLPDGLDVGDYTSAIGPAAGVMLVGFAEGLGAAKAYAAKQHYEIAPNRELLGLGAANVTSALCSGMVVNGSLSKTAVNGSAGARTQVSGLFVAVLTIVTLLFLTGLFEDLPEATLAAVVIAAVIELVDVRSLVDLHRVYTQRLGRYYGKAARPDFIAAVSALLGVLVFDTLPGLVIGIVVSLLLILYRSSRPHVAELGRITGTDGQYGDVERNPENELTPGIAIVRVEAGLFFANADWVREIVEAHAARPGVHAVVLDGGSIPWIDVSALKMLEEVAEGLARCDQRLVLAHNLGQVGDLLETMPDANLSIYRTIDDAIAAVTEST